MSGIITASQIANDAIVWSGVLGTLFGVAKSKWFQSALTFVKQEEPLIVAGVESVLNSPAAKIVEAELHHKLNDVETQLRKSELGKLAAEALHGLGVAFDKLSADQLKAVTLHIATLLPKEWNVSKSAIEEALKLVQQESESIASTPLIQAANQFTLEQVNAESGASE